MEKFYLHLTLLDTEGLHPSYHGQTTLVIEAKDTPLALNLMCAVGWVHASASPFSRHDWPQRPLRGNPEKLWNRWEEQCYVMLAFHGDESQTIPSYKLGTNEGWVITPEEISAAFHVWQPSSCSDPLSEIYSHLRMARQFGGVQVRLESFDG